MSEITAYAHEIARQERLITETNELYRKARKNADTLINRVSVLTQQKEKIVTARANGDETEENANRLVVITSDLKGLEPLLKQATEEATRLHEPVKQHKQLLDQAMQQLKVAEAKAEHTALMEKSRELESLLIEVINQTHEAGQRAGQRHFMHNWHPSNELFLIIKNRMLPKLGEVGKPAF